MERINTELDNVIQLFKENNSTYKSKINRIKTDLLAQETLDENQEIILVFLNFIMEIYHVNGLRTEKISDQNKEKIRRILVKINSDVGQNAEEEFAAFEEGYNEVIKSLATIAKLVYRTKQIFFIKNFYKNISLKNLEAFLGAKEAKNLIEKEEWEVTKGFVTVINRRKDDVTKENEVKLVNYFDSKNIQLTSLIQNSKELIRYQNNANVILG